MTNKKNKYNHKKQDHSQSTAKPQVNEEELTTQCLAMH
jgi:hypothetical protein